MFNLALDWDRPFVLRHDQPRSTDLYLRIRVQPQAGSGAARATLPAHLAIALDTSGSMADNDKLRRAREALRTLVGRVRPQDRFSLAAFATECRPLVAGAAGSPALAAEVEAAAGALQAGGVTRTDLALDWLRQTLGSEAGVARLGILITDGKPTDGVGGDLKPGPLQDLVKRGAALRGGAVTLWAIGVGPATDFNAGFLDQVTATGFLHAEQADALAGLLQKRLVAVQQMAASAARLTIVPRFPGLTLEALCRLAPDFSPLDRPAEPARGISVGDLRRDCETVYLARFDIPPPPPDQVLEQSLAVLEVGLEGTGIPVLAATARLAFTTSYAKSHSVNEEVDQARLVWQMHALTSRMVQSDDPLGTRAGAVHLKDIATRVNRPDVAQSAEAVIKEIDASPAGQEWKNRVSRTTTVLRNT